jgi:hypothetical protein
MPHLKQYLNRIMHFSFLSKHEKIEWKEEMESHLNSSIQLLQQDGLNREEAIQQAMKNFGNHAQIRKQLTKEIYGLSIKTIAILSGLFLSLFIYTTWTWVLPDIRLLSPTLMLAIFIGIVSLIKTRKQIDRILIPFAFSPFIIVYLSNVFFPHEAFVWYLRFIVSFWFPMNVFGVMFLAIFGLVLFIFSKNKYIAILPLLFSIAMNLCFLLRYTFRYIYLSFTDPSIISLYHLPLVSPLADIQITDLIVRLTGIFLMYFFINMSRKKIKLLWSLSKLLWSLSKQLLSS